MSPAHSPGSFRLYSRPPKGSDPGGHVITDACGDSMGGLAWKTGDHPPEEQLANAQLWAASSDLLEAAQLGRSSIAKDLRLTIEGHTVPMVGSHEPDLSTLEAIAQPVVSALQARLRKVDAAISRATGRTPSPPTKATGWFDRFIAQVSEQIAREDGLGGRR